MSRWFDVSYATPERWFDGIVPYIPLAGDFALVVVDSDPTETYCEATVVYYPNGYSAADDAERHALEVSASVEGDAMRVDGVWHYGRHDIARVLGERFRF